MKMQLLSHYFPLEVNTPAMRPYRHYWRWVEQGHEDAVVNCVRHRPRPMRKAYQDYRNKLVRIDYSELGNSGSRYVETNFDQVVLADQSERLVTTTASSTYHTLLLKLRVSATVDNEWI